MLAWPSEGQNEWQRLLLGSEAEFGARLAGRAIDVLTLTEMAWHDCYVEASPPGQVLDDILIVAEGDLDRLVEAALLAVTDFRALRLCRE